MTIEHWIVFAAACALLLAIPGPATHLVASYALGRGYKGAFAAAAGTTLGGAMTVAASLAIIGAVRAASPMMFEFLKMIGGGALVLSVIALWRAPAGRGPVADNDNLPHKNFAPVFAHTCAAAARNPRTILFFVALLSQILETGKSILQQAIVFESIFMTVSILATAVCVIFADRVRNRFRKAAAKKITTQTGGILRVNAGHVTVGYRRLAA